MREHAVGPAAAEHPVARKLRTEILPYFVSARRLRRQWFCLAHSVFGYTTDVLVLLTTLGVSSPLLNLVRQSGGTSPDGGPPPAKATLVEVLSAVPPFLYWPLLGAIAFWIVLRVTFSREDGQKRAVLARSCRLSLDQCEARLPHILGQSNPMPDLVQNAEQIRQVVDHNIKEQSWPWLPFAPGIEDEVAARLAQLREAFGANWLHVEARDLRKARKAS